jgi:imidazolonepropionase-like amidohydrolase
MLLFATIYYGQAVPVPLSTTGKAELLSPELTAEILQARATKEAGDMLLRGFTAVRDMGGSVLTARPQIDSGELPGPRNPDPGKLGVVEAGALADLLLINGGPLTNIDLVGNSAKNFVVIMKDEKSTRTHSGNSRARTARLVQTR